MTAFTYAAKRGIVKTALNVVGTDISVSAVDDSFNAVTTVLSGVLDNEWINVAGFVLDVVNNGWFQVNGNSTATKIIEDSVTPLITEAAGGSVSIQSYARGLDISYDLETDSHVLTPSDAAIINTGTALDGTVETVYTRNDAEWDILTDFITEQDFPQWREFMKSVSGGETFTFDAFGSIAVPDNPVQVIIKGRPTYSNPFGKTMQIRMRVKEI